MEKLLLQAENILKSAEHNVSLLANASAFLNEVVENINWVGFYLLFDGKLHLGPFQGKIACTSIDLDKGVCGFSFSNNIIVNLGNVHEFPGHIVCDNASNSEIVIPLTKNGISFGVLDVDSPIFERFDEKTEKFLIKFSEIIINYYRY